MLSASTPPSSIIASAAATMRSVVSGVRAGEAAALGDVGNDRFMSASSRVCPRGRRSYIEFNARPRDATTGDAVRETRERA
ncbi:MAG: hypothetical protein U1E86_16145 [Burkholderiaceae bacterium]